MKSSGPLLIGGAIPSLLFWVVLLSITKTTLGFQPTILTPQQRRTNELPGSGRKISPFRHRHLWYASPKSDNDPNKDTKKPESPKNKKTKGGVKQNSKTNQSPLNIFNQIFQQLGFSSDMIEEKNQQDDDSISSSSRSNTNTNTIRSDETKKDIASRKKKIVMPKQITTTPTAEKVKIKAKAKASKIKKKKPKAASVSTVSASPKPKPTPTIVPKTETTPILENDIVFPVAGDFQQRLLKASLAQRRKQQVVVKPKKPPPIVSSSANKKYQKSVKHIRVLTELSKSSGDTTSLSTTPTESTTKPNKKKKTTTTRKDKRTIKERTRKAADLTSKIAGKEDVTRRKNKPKVVVPTAKGTRREEGAKNVQKAKTEVPKRKQSKPPSSQTQQRLLEARFQSDKRAKDLLVEAKREQEAALNVQKAKKKKQVSGVPKIRQSKPKTILKPPSSQMQQQLLQARLQSEKRANDLLLEAKREQEAALNVQKAKKKQAPKIQQSKPKTILKPPSSQMLQQLLQARFQSEKRAKDLLLEAKRQQEALIVEQKKLEASQRKQYIFHRHLLEQKNTYEKEEAERKQQLRLEQEKLENLIVAQKKLEASQKKQYIFHRHLLEQKNTYDKEEAERNQQLRLEQEQLEQEKQELEAKNKRDLLLHQNLLTAQYQSAERAKTFKMKRLAQEILQQKEERRKQKEYQFQMRRLSSSLQSMKRQKEKDIQDKLNSLLQNASLIEYTKKKIGENENELIAKREEKKKQAEEQRLKLQEERLRSQAKADALKRAEQAKAKLEEELKAAAEKRIRDKHNSDFQQELMATRIRYDLVERKRLAEKRINELHQSLLAAQRESELAAAQVLEAEERKRQAQLELEERQKREEEEERKRQAQLELEEQQKREKEEAEKEAKRIEAEQRVQKQIKESKDREEAFRKDLENAGREQATTDTDPSAGGMNEYEAILEIQRKQAIQRRIDEGKRQQDELKRALENAGRTEASEQTMDRYEEILQQQKSKELQRRTEEAQRRQENLRRHLEEAGEAKAQDGTSSMDQYNQWVEQANKTSIAQRDSWQLPQAAAATVIQPRPENVRIEQQPSATLQPDLASPASPEVIGTQPQQQQQNQSDEDSLVGKVLLDKFLIAEKLRVGGDRSELYKCYHVLDKPQQYALVIKLSHNIQQIELEHRIYGDLFSRLSQDRQELFVRAYDWVPASDLTSGRVGFAMECGLENLRGHIWRHGPYSGDKLRSTMENVIRIVQALHGLGVVWSELKAENFIVFDGDKIKAVDLESVAAHNECLRAYTAETYPPEFPADSLYQCLPKIPVDYSFDVWGMGLTLYELAVGEPLFTLQRTYDVDYIKERLKNPEGIVDEANKKMWKVEAGARNIIRKCLVVDPTKRSSCDELLQDPYFTNAKQSPPPAFPSAMGSI